MVYRSFSEHGSRQSVIVFLAGTGNTMLKAPDTLESRASLRSSQVVMLASAGFLEPASPFQSHPRGEFGRLQFGRWSVVVTGTPRSPLPPSASRTAHFVRRFATDHSGLPACSRGRAAGLKWMCPRRQRVSPSVAPLAGFRVPALCAACASRAICRRGCSATVALDTDPLSGPDTSGHIPLAARSGRVGARCWLGHLTQARSRSRPVGRSRRRERERTDVTVGRSRRKTAM
ncbi:hypothetical protein ATJ93_4632 [Halopiger aswanensis]|uniref:Uncharacterized protein n=1 Tax=Halopiger aswanensis TaxID=148449 RepID=A0A3R7HFL8_9EURY|nr:hypothetical protein ATJ93_4632 [Halopiger aswanensis]